MRDLLAFAALAVLASGCVPPPASPGDARSRGDTSLAPPAATPAPLTTTAAPSVTTPAPPAASAPAATTPLSASGEDVQDAPESSSSTRAFDRAATMKALSRAAEVARKCQVAGGPTGSGRVKVSWAPSGIATSAAVMGPPFEGTPVGACIAMAFRQARIPPFEGNAVAVSKSFALP